MFKIILNFFLLFNPLFFLFVSCSNSKINKFSYVFIKNVYDGDTFISNNNKKYRLFGVDTPEISDQFHNFKTTTGIEYFYAKKAKDYVSSLILNQNIKTNIITKDKYNRYIASFFYDKKDLAEELLKQGLARIAYFNVSNSKSPYYSNKFKYFQKLTIAQKYAVDNKKGIWNNIKIFKTIFSKL